MVDLILLRERQRVSPYVMWGIFAVFAFLLAECGIRLVHANDFPLISVDNFYGYAPQPNQAGIFLGRSQFVINDKDMPIRSRWTPDQRPDVAVIGNSVIYGGNPYDQNEKVGELLQAFAGQQLSIWPVAMGGWSTVNEVRFLERNPDIVKAADLFVWEYMSGGLSRLNDWPGYYVFPDHKPLCMSCYLIRRIVGQKLHLDKSPLPPTGAVDPVALKEFDAMLGKLAQHSQAAHPGIILLYPKRAELAEARAGHDWLPERAVIQALADKYHLVVVDLAAEPTWQDNLYAEKVHPNVTGNAVLARLVADQIHQIAPVQIAKQ